MGKCRVEGVVYEIECQVCKKNGVRRVYLDETGRSVYERMLNHCTGMTGAKRRKGLVYGNIRQMNMEDFWTNFT